MHVSYVLGTTLEVRTAEEALPSWNSWYGKTRKRFLVIHARSLKNFFFLAEWGLFSWFIFCFRGGCDSLVAQTVKNLPANSGDPGLIPGLGRSPGGGNGNQLQDSCLKNPMDGGALGRSPWCCKESDMTEWLSLHFTEEVRQHIKKQRHHFADLGPSSQSYGFSSSHVRMWE